MYSAVSSARQLIAAITKNGCLPEISEAGSLAIKTEDTSLRQLAAASTPESVRLAVTLNTGDTARAVPFDDVSSATFVADIEQVVGGKSAVVLKYLRFVKPHDEDYILYTIYESNLGRISEDYGFSLPLGFSVFRYAFLMCDMDLLLDFMKSIYDVTWFPGTRGLFKEFSRIIYLL